MTKLSCVWSKWIPTVLFVASVLHCGKENEVDASTHVESGIGAQCSGDDATVCGVGAACVLGYCRSGCTTDAECPQGTLCIGDTPPFGCQLPQDVSCSPEQACHTPLVCGLDAKCRWPCNLDTDCPRNEHRCISGACVSVNEKGFDDTWGSCSYLQGGLDAPLRCSTTHMVACNVVQPGEAEVYTCPSGFACGRVYESAEVPDAVAFACIPADCIDGGITGDGTGGASGSLCGSEVQACRDDAECNLCMQTMTVRCTQNELWLKLGRCGTCFWDVWKPQ